MRITTSEACCRACAAKSIVNGSATLDTAAGVAAATGNEEVAAGIEAVNYASDVYDWAKNAVGTAGDIISGKTSCNGDPDVCTCVLAWHDNVGVPLLDAFTQIGNMSGPVFDCVLDRKGLPRPDSAQASGGCPTGTEPGVLGLCLPIPPPPQGPQLSGKVGTVLLKAPPPKVDGSVGKVLLSAPTPQRLTIAAPRVAAPAAPTTSVGKTVAVVAGGLGLAGALVALALKVAR